LRFVFSKARLGGGDLEFKTSVVKVVRAIGRIMQVMPDVTEIDVNPLMVHGTGLGATALDALIVTG
jgi:succinyl-CoA synthetase beta subunit